MPLLRLALPTPLRRLFDYRCIAGQPVPPVGGRIEVPFGRRKLIGVLVEVAETSEYPLNKLKTATLYLDERPLFDQQELDFLGWVASYYHQPLGEVLALAMPALLRQGQAVFPQQQPRWQLTTAGEQLDAAALRQAPRQAALLRYMQKQANSLLRQRDIQEAGFTLAQLQGLQAKKLAISVVMKQAQGIGLPEIHPDTAVSRQVLAEVPPALTAEQAEVLAGLQQKTDGFAPALLQGVTGSGKTEVYLRLIQQLLEQHRQVLVLIPEIGLTPQTLQRFQQRFNRKVVALHSGLTDRERLDAWRSAWSGEADVVLGTRSSIFTPMPRLGLILVDEEHDASFKQQDSVRYQARDLAVMRAKRWQLPVVLGSATPSLETLRHALQGRYAHYYLKQRPTQQTEVPQPLLLDVRGQRLSHGFSEPLLQVMQTHLQAGNQVLVLLNRRGYAPVLMCHHCGWIAGCTACDARMTWHREPAGLQCHHCGKQQPVPLRCPVCQEDELLSLGTGTEKAEDFLQQRLPEYPVIRIDRDSVRHRHALQEKLLQIQQQSPAILLGTQMLAKGHHFPAVTLATLLDADQGLYSSDPKAIERTAQLLIQVAGRAGRADKPGKVLIQTCHVDDPRLVLLCQQGYEALARQLLQERAQGCWPPYAFLAMFRADAVSAEPPRALLEWLAAQARQHPLAVNHQVQLMGPVPAPMERRQGHYHMQLLLHSTSRQSLHQLLHLLLVQLESSPLARKARWSVDVDPEDLF